MSNIAKLSGTSANIDVDFFVIGFPKCGTTSMAKWLSDHEDIGFSKPKEPGFYCNDLPGKQKITSHDGYNDCWSHCDQEKCFGEGTVVYIYSRQTIETILLAYPDAKFVVMVRRPDDLIRSLHSNNFRSFQENVSCLEEAWDLQEQRLAGRKIPNTCKEPFFLQYREVARQGKYLQQLVELCGKEKVHVIFFDDVASDSKKEYEDLISFLGLEVVHYPDFSPANVQKSFTTGLIPQVSRHILKLFRLPALNKSGLSSSAISLKVQRMLYRLCTEEDSDRSMHANLRNTIRSELEADVAILRELTGRSLADW